MDAWLLRQQVVNDEIDYNLLKSILAQQVRYPRDKITALIAEKALIRVKKGLYVFNKPYAQKPYSKELLANLIYGPSAISLTYALAFYGLIPERVITLTSITPKRHKCFNTPVGHFNYYYCPIRKYAIGITQLFLDETHPILIATPEKALADQLTLGLKVNLQNQAALEQYLLEDLRIDEDQLSNLNRKRIKQIADTYQHSNINLLSTYLEGANHG